MFYTTYAVLAEESLTRPGFLQTLPAHQLFLHFVAKRFVRMRYAYTRRKNEQHFSRLATFWFGTFRDAF